MEELRHCHTAILADEIERDKEGGSVAGVNLHEYVPKMVEAEGYSWALLSGSPAEICGVLCIEKGDFVTCEHNLAIWVKPSHRRKGLCVNATRKVFEILKDYGVRRVAIIASKDNLPMTAAVDAISQELDVDIVHGDAEYKQWVIDV